MKNQLYEAISVPFVERSSRINGTWKNIIKKAHTQFWFPVKDFKISDNFYKNPKVPKIVLGFINQPQRFTPPYYLDVDNPLKQNIKTQIVTKLKNKNCDN